jgi:hypothetical protein
MRPNKVAERATYNLLTNIHFVLSQVMLAHVRRFARSSRIALPNPVTPSHAFMQNHPLLNSFSCYETEGEGGFVGSEQPIVTTFRINTCKSVSKQRTLTTFRMNTYEKTGEGGSRASLSYQDRP